MVRNAERIRDNAAEILVRRNNEPMLIRDLLEELMEYPNSAKLPNPTGLSQILRYSRWFVSEGCKDRTYRLRPDIYERLKGEAVDS